MCRLRPEAGQDPWDPPSNLTAHCVSEPRTAGTGSESEPELPMHDYARDSLQSKRGDLALTRFPTLRLDATS
jgi:hypothetical protein